MQEYTNRMILKIRTKKEYNINLYQADNNEQVICTTILLFSLQFSQIGLFCLEAIEEKVIM